MRVLVTGATGFIGRHLAYALASAGHEVICCARDPAQPQRRLAGLSWVHADLTRDFPPGDWLLRLQAVDAVVNAEGILGEAGAQTLEALHVRAPQALFAACVKPMSEKSRRYPRSELTRMPPAVITFQKNRLTITCLASRERPRWGARERDEVAIE